MELIIGAIFGIVIMLTLFYFLNVEEWSERRRLNRRVDDIEKHLSCAQGFLGCKAGKYCTSDHK